MRKTMWMILMLLVGAIVAPCVRADTVTFTCTGDNNNGMPTPPFYGPCLVAVPTAPNVTFPSPTLDITWDSQSIDIPLPVAWPDDDSYSWFASDNFFFIFNNSPMASPGSVSADAITNLPPVSSGFGLSEFGTLTFTPGSGTVAAPEPNTVTLMLIGIGLLGLIMMMRKRTARGLPQFT
jgi:hypothetical protein